MTGLFRVSFFCPRMAGTILSLLLAAALASSPALAQSRISGVYVSASTDGAFMVQIVATRDGQVSGRVETARLTDDGRVRQDSASVEGVTDGTQLTLRPRSSLASFFGESGFTGRVSGQTLTLSKEGAQWTLRRGAVADYHAALARLEQRGGEIRLARSAARAMATYQRLLQISDALEAELPRIHGHMARAGEIVATLRARAQDRHRTADAILSRTGYSMAATQAEMEAYAIEREIDRVAGHAHELHGRFAYRLDGAYAMWNSLTRHCEHTAELTPTMCATLPDLEQRLRGIQSAIRDGPAAPGD